MKDKQEALFNNLCSSLNLNPTKTQTFIDKCFKNGMVEPERYNREIADLMLEKPNLLLGDAYINEKKNEIISQIQNYFDIFFNL